VVGDPKVSQDVRGVWGLRVGFCKLTGSLVGAGARMKREIRNTRQNGGARGLNKRASWRMQKPLPRLERGLFVLIQGHATRRGGGGGGMVGVQIIKKVLSFKAGMDEFYRSSNRPKGVWKKKIEDKTEPHAAEDEEFD